MATKKRSSIPLSGSGIDWSTLALDPAANPEPAAEDAGPPTMLSRMKRGFGSTMNAAAIGAAGRDDLAGLVAGEAANQLPGSPAAQAMQQEVKPYVDAANNAEGLQAVGAWATLAAKRIGQFASNPREFAGMIAENLPNSVPGMAGTIAGGMAGAAAAGPVGGLAGSVVGGTAGGYLIEQGAAMREQIMKEAQARGVDARDPNALAPIIAEKYDEFLKSARLKGIGTAGTDAILNRLTLGIAGMGEKAIIKGAGATGTALKAGAITAEQAGVTMTELAAKQAARTTMGRGLARGAGVTGMEMAGEGLSEAAGQALAYGKVDAGDVVDESLLGLGQGGAMAATRGMYGKAVGASTSSDADAAIASLGESIRATKLPEGGPMTRAANAATEAQAKAAEAGKPPLEFTTTDLPPGKADSLALADKPDSTALDFEADPRFAGAMPFDNGAAPAQPVFSSKTLADIHIGEQGAMGEMEAVEAGGGQWTVKQTDQAANRTARANIEQWTLKAQPMPEERARSMVKDAETQLGKKMTALPMPDGSGWTVVPTQWVSAPILMDYVEHASAAEQALAAEQAVADRAVADRNARVSKAASEPVKRAPRTPSTGAVEIDLAAPNAVAQFIAKQAGINTPAARAFVQGYRAGRITDDEVLARINPKRTGEPSADERIAAAAAQAPAPAPSPAGLILNREGQPFKSERAANIEHKKHAGSSVVQVPGGHAVQPATDAKPAAAAADTGASDDQAKAASVPAPADPAAVEKVADPAGAGTAEAPATGAAGPVPGPADLEADGLIDPFKLDKATLNQRLDDIVATNEAPDLIQAFTVLRRRYEKASGKKSTPPAGSRYRMLQDEAGEPVQSASAADKAVDRADAMGLKGQDRKDAVAQDLAAVWGMTADEVRDAEEFTIAIGKRPRKAPSTKATERFVDEVVRNAIGQSQAADAKQQTTPASNAAAQDTQPAPDGEAAGATEAAAPTEAPAALPDPFADNYTALNGTTITQQVLVADTGKTATLRMDAGQALRDVNEREQALTKLKACIGR